MSDKTEQKWYYLGDDNSQEGPLSTAQIREKAVEGVITSETRVSNDGQVWKSAVLCPDLGFDCLVLEAGDALNVLGPFPKEYLDRPDVTQSVSPSGVFFVRSGTLADAVVAPTGSATSGETGAALVERVLAAENALRQAERQRREADASLKARDLEFDAERQRFQAEISALKAENLKLKSQAEGLRADVEKAEKAERQYLATTAKLADLEKALAEVSERLNTAENKVIQSENQCAALVEKLKVAESTCAQKVSDAQSATDAARNALAAKCAVLDSVAAKLKSLSDSVATEVARSAEHVDAVEPEIIVVEESSPMPVVENATSSMPNASNATNMAAALEAQLKRELSMAAATRASKQSKRK